MPRLQARVRLDCCRFGWEKKEKGAGRSRPPLPDPRSHTSLDHAKHKKQKTQIEGRGNGIKTNVVNNVDIAKALERPPDYIVKYYGCELGAQTKFDKKVREGFF
jgi:translation initiation factor 2 beta subunit (eIF-2beta)/eIF-5